MKQKTKGKIASLIMAGAMMASVAIPASAASTSGYTVTAQRYNCGQVVSQARSTVDNMNREVNDLANQFTISGNAANDIHNNRGTFINGIKNIANENAQTFLKGIGA